MFANLDDVGWLIATQWLQLSIAGVAIVHALAEVVRSWRESGKPRVAIYAPSDRLPILAEPRTGGLTTAGSRTSRRFAFASCRGSRTRRRGCAATSRARGSRGSFTATTASPT